MHIGQIIIVLYIHTGHYQQDANTYASWGVECEPIIVIVFHFSPLFVFCVNIDVKMDWCHTEINGTQLDPKVQYPEMVRAIH